MDFILDHLAIGNAAEGAHPPPQVTALLCVAGEVDLPQNDLIQHKVPIADMQPIPVPQLKEAVDWITHHIATETILVYCNAGVGRSSSVVVSYLCYTLGYGFGEAVEYVARQRPYTSILPNLILSISELKTP